MQQHPGDSSAHANLALLLAKADSARQGFTKAINLDPTNKEAYINLANFYHLQRNLPKSIAVFDTGLEANPDALKLYLALADFH